MKPRRLAPALLFLFLAPSVSAQNDWTGTWVSGAFEGVQRWNHGRCSSISLRQQHLEIRLLHETTAAYDGLYSSTRVTFLTTSSGSCILPTIGGQVVSSASTIWQIRASRQDEVGLQLYGVRGECVGPACEGEVSPFTATLLRREKGLKWIGDAGEMIFVRKAEFDRLQEQSTAEVRALLRSLFRGNCGEFEKYAASSLEASWSEGSSAEVCEQELRRLGPATQRQFLAEYLFVDGPGELGILLYQAAQTRLHGTVTEFFFLRKKNSDWKLFVWLCDH